MFGSIKYNLTHLFDFRGRDARQTFWYYVLFVVILRIIVGIGMAIPTIGAVMGKAMEAAKSGAPADPQALAASSLAGMGPWLQTAAYVSIAVGLVTIVLLLAAFVRRLHDSGNSGWWAALAVAAQLAALWSTYVNIGRINEVLSQATRQIQTGGTTTFNTGTNYLGLLGWLAIIIVLVFGILKSTDGPNRYGEAPVEF